MIAEYEKNKKVSGLRAFRINSLVTNMKVYRLRRVFDQLKLSDTAKLKIQKARVKNENAKYLHDLISDKMEEIVEKQKSRKT